MYIVRYHGGVHISPLDFDQTPDLQVIHSFLLKFLRRTIDSSGLELGSM